MAATQAEADIHLEGVTQALRRDDGGRRPHAVDPARQLLRDARPVGLRQDDDAADDRRLRGPDRRARVFLGGADVTEQPPYKRDVNTVFQSYALFPHLSVEKNVAFGLERKKVGKAEVRKRASARRSSSSSSAISAKRKPGAALRRPGSSASRSPARWSTARARCCSTSRSARSTCACASSCRSSSSASSRRSASRSCT